MRRLFDVDPASKQIDTFHYDESDDRFHIATKQDVTDILDWNRFRQGEDTGRWGDVAHVARIDANTWDHLVREGIAHDNDRLDKWLMDPDNRKFRTKLGRL